MSLQNMFARTYYLRFDAQRIRLDAPGAKGRYDDTAAVALRDAATKQARIEATGRAAETLGGQHGISVVHPFAHPRMVIGDYTVAERLVMMAVRTLHQREGWSFFRPIARFIVHPLRAFEGGLTQIEVRALTELVENCGARQVAVYSGRELTLQEVEAYSGWPSRLGPVR